MGPAPGTIGTQVRPVCQDRPVPKETPQGSDQTTCLVAGGGPAGMMLALLLARAGVDVTVMEKHADFLRDFRGDTVHASTLRLLDELGLGSRFAEIPHRLIDTMQMQMEGQAVDLDLTHLPGAHQHIALVPQWDFLELLASAAESEPSFRLLRSTEVTGVIRGTGPDRGRIIGVKYRDQSGETKEMRAQLTVACDGRSSTVRSAMGLVPQAFGAPMDVWWFRLPRQPDDPPGLAGTFSAGHGCILIDRGDYYQIAYIIPKGTDADMRAEGIEALHRVLVRLVPWLADRVATLSSFDDVKLLDVQLNRLHRWYSDGVLFIGDAAHAMSPVGGVGINLAVADAVATARLLAKPLRAGRVSGISWRWLALVQMRRWVPTALIQAVQRMIHTNVIAAAVKGEGGDAGTLRAVRLVSRTPALRRTMGYMMAIGPLPEHTPKFARRPG
jgi:2-polyprenyl-6-methoxyphenol hydroxylase-like FAD-dependent oxidoreductase